MDAVTRAGMLARRLQLGARVALEGKLCRGPAGEIVALPANERARLVLFDGERRPIEVPAQLLVRE